MTAGGPIVLAMTGASGAPYAVRLLQVLCRAGKTVHLTISTSGAQVLGEETGLAIALARFDPAPFGDLGPGRLVYHDQADFGAGIASGSFRTAGMVISPCSMSTLAGVAHGITTNLITRAADVHLKERRKLILVPRTSRPWPALKSTWRTWPPSPRMQRGDRPARDARLVSQAKVARRPRRLRRGEDLRPARRGGRAHESLGRSGGGDLTLGALGRWQTARPARRS